MKWSIELTEEQAAVLVKAMRSGELKKFGVVEARVVRPAAVEESAESEARQSHTSTVHSRALVGSPAHPEEATSPGGTTVLETEEGRSGDKPPLPRMAVGAAPAVLTAQPFHPTQRPPVAILTVCDDGKLDGEVIRLRSDRFVIGRTEGDLLIPNDEMISGRHAEIVRRPGVGGLSRWNVVELDTPNGLFVRVGRAVLRHGAEFMVGSARYCFKSDEVAEAVPDPPGTTAELFELGPVGPVASIPLTLEEYWIGTDPSCAICPAGDPFVDKRHARIHHINRHWHLENNKSVNGVWLRVREITVDCDCQFQIGEQRFRLRVD
jgi:pSer/pThr/pTyr-binding forkhead associated (FHA) protein